MGSLARRDRNDGEERLDLATDYVLRLFADAMNVDVADLQELDLADPLSLTSVQNMTIVSQLDASIGAVPLTLLFDRSSPAAVIDYLVSERSSEFDRLAVAEEPAEKSADEASDADGEAGSGFAYAYIYNKYFTSLANSARVPIAAYFKRRGDGHAPVLLDLCCGTGQLACYFAGTVTVFSRLITHRRCSPSRSRTQRNLTAVMIFISSMPTRPASTCQRKHHSSPRLVMRSARSPISDRCANASCRCGKIPAMKACSSLT